jgi:hypothetical protein
MQPAIELEFMREIYKSLYTQGHITRGSVVGSRTMIQAESSRGRFQMSLLVFSIELILPAALWSWGRLSI